MRGLFHKEIHYKREGRSKALGVEKKVEQRRQKRDSGRKSRGRTSDEEETDWEETEDWRREEAYDRGKGRGMK